MRNGNKAGTIQTVLGAVSATQLGFCQCHEHLFIRRGRSYESNPALRMEDIDKAIAELNSYHSAGGRAVVDAQPGGCGRMAASLWAASLSSGVHIIASTGFHKMVFYQESHWIYHESQDKLARLFIGDIVGGMIDECRPGEPALPAGCRAGVIKAAIDTCGITGRYAALFDAVVASSLETGAAVLLHVESGADATEALEFLTGRGVPPCSLIFCHLDRADRDVARHVEIARAGAFLEYDTIGRFKYHSDEYEIGLIEHVLAAGLQDRLLLSLDTTRERLKCYGGALGLDYIQTVFLPKLREHGIDEGLLQKITVDNPAAALAIRFE